MKILREDIGSEGLQTTFSLSHARPGDLGEENVVLAIVRPPQGEFQLMPMAGNMVRVRGRFSSLIEVCCCRCLRPLPLGLKGDLAVVFQPQPLNAEDEIMLSARELEVYFYDGVELDLGQVLLSELSLLIPYAPLCEGECASVCAKCGHMPCQCGQTKIDPRWNKLAGLKFD